MKNLAIMIGLLLFSIFASTSVPKLGPATPLPWLEVQPNSTVLGPEPVLSREFEVRVGIVNLDQEWCLVGIRFRLSYDPALLQVVLIDEGPFLPSFPSRSAYPYTSFIGVQNTFDPQFGSNVHVEEDLLSNDEGYYTGFAHGNGTVATIRFRAISQSWTGNLTHTFRLLDISLTDQNNVEIPFDAPRTALYTVFPLVPSGARLDVWLGDYQAPYGGQGFLQPADLVLPEQEINVTAQVTYNWSPVAGKNVTIRIYDKVWQQKAVFEKTTNSGGYASTIYTMPWSGPDPERLLGVWHVQAEASVAGSTENDTFDFHYDYVARIWSVVTDKSEYSHLETVRVSVNYGTHCVQLRLVVLYAIITDELSVPVGMIPLATSAADSTFGTYKNSTGSVSIVIPFWAFAGQATTHVAFLDKLPWNMGAVALTPEFLKTIWILPF